MFSIFERSSHVDGNVSKLLFDCVQGMLGYIGTLTSFLELCNIILCFNYIIQSYCLLLTILFLALYYTINIMFQFWKCKLLLIFNFSCRFVLKIGKVVTCNIHFLYWMYWSNYKVHLLPRRLLASTTPRQSRYVSTLSPTRTVIWKPVDRRHLLQRLRNFAYICVVL